MGWRKVAILGEDYSFPYTQAAGFVSEFTSLGGEVTARTWVPLTQTDWSSPVAQLPARRRRRAAADRWHQHHRGGEGVHPDRQETRATSCSAARSVMDPTSFTVGDQLDGLVGGSPVPVGGDDGGLDDVPRRVHARSSRTSTRRACSPSCTTTACRRSSRRSTRSSGDRRRPGGLPAGPGRADADVPPRRGHPGREPQLGPAELRRADRQGRRRARASSWSRRSTTSTRPSVASSGPTRRTRAATSPPRPTGNPPPWAND